MILDLLSSHKLKEVKDYGESKLLKNGQQALYFRFLKPKTAFAVRPLYIGCIPTFKSDYYKMDRSTLKLKFQAAKAEELLTIAVIPARIHPNKGENEFLKMRFLRN